MRHVAIYGGGDWADASVDHLLIPDGVNLEVVSKEYLAWLRETYQPAMNRGGEHSTFYTFPAWLVAYHGATPDDSIEEFEAP